MPSILKREFAPISDQAWQEIDETAAQAIKRNISSRKVVDVDGPHGWELGAVNIGRIDVHGEHGETGIGWGTRKVVPLIECRTGFAVNQMELDDIARGSKNPDLDKLEEVVAKAAQFEDMVVYKGFKEGKMVGILEACEHDSIVLPAKAEDYPRVVSQAIEKLESAGVEGPYSLVLGPDQYYGLLQNAKQGYPSSRIVKDLIQGEIVHSMVVDGGILISQRGGDFELTLGKDFSIGYASHDRQNVELFVAESFAFRVLDPSAAVGFTVKV